MPRLSDEKILEIYRNNMDSVFEVWKEDEYMTLRAATELWLERKKNGQEKIS